VTRVRHLLKGLGPGGAERLVVAQATAPGSIEHDVVYLVPEKHHLVSILDAAGVSSRCLDAPSAARLGWIRRLRRMLQSEPVDVLHVHSPALAAVTRILVRTLPRGERPVVISTEHNRWPRHHRVTRLANRLTIRLQAATIAVSADVRSTVRGVAPDRVTVVVHGIDIAAVRATADRAGIREELGIDDADIVIVCVANLRREKALDVLIAAAARALDEEPDLRYLLVGQGPLADDVDRWIADAGIGDRFTALGYRADATRVISAGDALTLSSAHEGLPVAVMEALALGLPIVATAAGGVPDAAGTAGLISAVGDAEALAAHHLELARGEQLRRDLALAAMLEAQRFELSRAISEIEEIYAAAIDGTRAADNSHS
jgi:glycosyltransferase involved in cell wall biosynthesis